MLPPSRTAEGAAGLASLIATLRSDPARALVALDYDGTLAPVVGDPAEARPADGVVDALRALATTGAALVVLTGRPAADVVALAGLTRVPGLVVLGHYGLERWDADSGAMTAPPEHPGVAGARLALPALAAAYDGASVEDKGRSVALHTRGAADPAAALDALRPAVDRLAGRCGLEVAPGRYVLELRPAGTDKGTALRAVVAERGPAALLMAGDDLGDLPAFAAVEGLRAVGIPGVTVASRSAEQPSVADRADVVVEGAAGVVALLRALVAASGT